MRTTMNKAKKIGAPEEIPRITIGALTICKQTSGNLWIEQEDGEGSEFSENMLEKVLRKFYDDNY
jgi:hypothetical protein